MFFLALLEEAKKEIDSYSKGGPISYTDLIQYAGFILTIAKFKLRTIDMTNILCIACAEVLYNSQYNRFLNILSLRLSSMS